MAVTVTVTAVSPADTGTLAKNDYIVVDITSADLADHAVYVRFESHGTDELAYVSWAPDLATAYEIVRHDVVNGYRYRIRRRGGWVRGMGPPSISAVSSEDHGTPGLTYPNGGESLVAGESEDITWTPTGSGWVDFDLDYSTDNGSSWTPITTGEGSSPYSWTVPSDVSDEALVRVVGNKAAVTVTDVSDAVFSILDPVWPSGATLMESVGSCVSAWYADDATFSGDTVLTIPDQEEGSDWSGGTLELIGAESIGAAASPADYITNTYSGANSDWTNILGNNNDRLYLNGLTFVVRAKTFGRYEWYGTSNRGFRFKVDGTNFTLQWTTAGGGTQTLTQAHGADTSTFALWAVTVKAATAFPPGTPINVEFFRNGVQVGSTQTLTRYTNSVGTPIGRFGSDGVTATEAMAAGAFAAELSTAQMLDFLG